MQPNVNSPDWADSRKLDLTALVLSGSRRSGSLNTRFGAARGALPQRDGGRRHAGDTR